MRSFLYIHETSPVNSALRKHVLCMYTIYCYGKLTIEQRHPDHPGPPQPKYNSVTVDKRAVSFFSHVYTLSVGIAALLAAEECLHHRVSYSSSR